MIARVLLAAGVLLGVLQGKADEDAYATLCTNVIAALGDGKRLTSSAFTNQMHAYRSDVDIRVRSLAELALSDALLTMCDELPDFEAYEEGCRSCSNVLFSAELPVRSWQKSVASLFYAWALRMDGKRDESLAVCRTALSTHLASPTMNVERAVWSAMSRETGLPEMSITNSLKLAAALSVPAERRPAEWTTYTNGLPPQAMRLLHERPMVGKEGDWR